MAAAFAGLQHDSERWFERESVPKDARRTAWSASLRYEHQGFELTVDWPGTVVDDAAVRETVRRFHELHRATYTFAQEDTPVEIVTLRVDASGSLPQPKLTELAPGGDPAAAIVKRQAIHLDSGIVEAPIYDRARLSAGARIAGPAIVTQLDATTLLLPHQTAEMHPTGSLIVREDQ